MKYTVKSPERALPAEPPSALPFSVADDNGVSAEPMFEPAFEPMSEALFEPAFEPMSDTLFESAFESTPDVLFEPTSETSEPVLEAEVFVC